MDNLLEGSVKELKGIDCTEEYDAFVQKYIKLLRQCKYEAEVIQNIRNKGKYVKSPLSDRVTRESMLKSKEDLLLYLESLLFEKQEEFLQDGRGCLETCLNNFYLFLEAFKEVVPDKRATLTVEDLQKIRIENEYDLQHLLYAVLKPLYADIRKEVTEDSGLSAIRSDLLIPSQNTVVEAKCTRDKMQRKKLIEELEADIFHYNAAFIYFYIYDRAKLIKDKHTFETYFNRSFDGKQVRVVILQPVNM